MGWKLLSKNLAPEGFNLRVIIQCRCCDAQHESIASFDKERGWRLESSEPNVLVEDDGNYLITHWRKLKTLPSPIKFTKKQILEGTKETKPYAHQVKALLQDALSKLEVHMAIPSTVHSKKK